MAKLKAQRLELINPSVIMGLVHKARQIASTGRPIIDLGIGEPDFETPAHIKESAIEAIRNNITKYTVVAGEPRLREAIVAKFMDENFLTYSVNEISVSGGAKQAIFNTMMASLSPGDEVIIPSPYWSSYLDIVEMCQGIPVVVECSPAQRFLITAEQLERAIGSRTKWLILNSPSNPAGGVFRPEQLKELAQVLEENPDVHILSDDIYEHFMFDENQFTSILNVAPQLRERTVIVNGVSKIFAMTGWRLGYCAGPKYLIDNINAVQSHSTTHASSISQAAAVAALTGPKEFIAERSASYQQRRDIVITGLTAAERITSIVPDGAFYVYPNCSGVIGAETPSGQTIADDVGFCSWLLECHGISTVPGVAFGLSPHFRISTAASEEAIESACTEIVKACSELVFRRE